MLSSVLAVRRISRFALLKFVLLSCCGLSVSGFSAGVLAWGERGHDVITRVAVQNLKVLSGNDIKLVKPFVARDHMLGHLSNAPDIVWRADYMSEEVLRLNPPTHYINIEKAYPSPKSIDDLDRDFAKYTQSVKAKGFDNPSQVGTAPWRALQMYQLLVSVLKEAKASDSQEARVAATNKALTYAGIMSHFVGDLANPHHTTNNYDGQLTGHRGLHAYFESDVVAELSLDLIARVGKKAKHGLATLTKTYPAAQSAELLQDPSKLIFALVVNSNLNVSRLMALDNRYSLLESSPIDAESRQRAKRKPPAAVAERYKRFAVQRLALGAATLSQLWYLAWQEAEQPDLSEFQSYYYPVQPEFIVPDYLDN